MIIHNPILTGSFTVNGTDVSSITSSAANLTALNAITASILSTTGSLNTASGSAITRLNALEVTSGSNITRLGALEVASGSAITRLGSIETVTGSNITRLSSLEAKTGSYATTGSNTFVDTQTISGSILQSGSFTSTGTLTAQTLVVQTITSSVDFVTGSTRFGSLAANTHQFTGSVGISGSLTSNGALSGTSATFTDKININADQGAFRLYNNAAAFVGGIGNGSWVEGAIITNVALYSIGDLKFYTSGSSANKLTIASTGAATFTAATQDAIQTVVRMSGNNASSQLKALDFKLTAGTPLWTISTAASGTDAGINIMPNGSAGLSLAYAGAATFSGNLAINDTLSSPGNLIETAGNNVYLRPASSYKVFIDTGTGLSVSGTINATDLILQGSTNLNYNYTTNSGWASSFQTIIPVQGAQASGAVYLVRVNWGGGGSPYVVYGAFLWVCMGSNGGGADNTITPMISTHQGGAGTMNFRNLAGAGQVASGIQVQLIGFADPNGSLGVTATRLM